MNNKLILKYSDTELQFAKKIISKYKKEYAKLKNKSTYNNRDIVILIMKKIISNYPFFNNNAIIFFTGSYSRGLLNSHSDFDLNIAYKKGTGKKYKRYEELFYFVVCKIFNMIRKKVHPVFVTFNNPINTQKINVQLDKKDFNIILKSQNFSFEYNIKADSKRRMFLQYINNKNFNVLFDNIIKYFYPNQIEEWMFNFYFLNNEVYSNKKVLKYFQQLLNDKTKIKLFKSQIILDIENHKKYRLFDCKHVKDIKSHFQSKSLNIIYNYVLLLQFNNENCDITMNFDYLNEKIYLQSEIKEYLNTLNELYILFDNYGIEYSLHNNDYILIQNYSDICNQLLILESKFKKIVTKVTHKILSWHNFMTVNFIICN